VEFRLPDLGEGLEEAEVVEWLVAEGAVVERDQPIVAVSTDKAVVELPSPVAGRVSRRRGVAGERLRVGEVVAVIEEAAAVGAAPTARPAARPRAAPAVRRLAVELGVDLQAVAPSGPDGRILADDVRLAANGGGAPATAVGAPAPPPPPSAPPPVPAAGVGQAAPGRHPLTGIRRRTAEVVAEAWSTIPHIANMDEVDASLLLEARDRLRRVAGEQAELIGVMPLLVMATARTLRRFPLVNAHLDAAAGEVEVHEAVHLGIAVASPDGLVVPVVRDAGRRGLLDLATEIARLVSAARSRGLRRTELEGATCTVTNFGALGAGRFSVPVIRPPEVAIIGFGAIAPRPLVVDGEVVARPALPYVVTVDHRVLDGDVVCAVSAALAGTLADPLGLLLG
jgi:pyruvate/2-oxoglutarate dehydrogenase complex dihydrolipoamide acyltransferase (E2) component